MLEKEKKTPQRTRISRRKRIESIYVKATVIAINYAALTMMTIIW